MLVKLKDIAKIVSGGTPSTKHPEYYNGEIFWFTPYDLSNNKDFKYISKSDRKITKLGFEKSSSTMIPPYNILLTSRAPIGYLAINKNECCTNQGFKSLIINKQLADIDYIYYWLKYNIKKIENLGAGTTFKELSKNNLENVEIELPSLNKQKEISKILNLIDNQIEINYNVIKRLQVMGQGIFDMFLNNAKDYENIESLCKIIWGQCPKGNNILNENVSNNLTLYASGAGDLENNKILISPKAFTDKPIKIIDNRTICMSIAGTVGKIGISDKKIAIGRAMVGFYNEKKFGLIYFILNKYSSFLKRQSIGAIQKIINKNHLNIVNVPILTNEKNNLLNELITKCMKLEKNTLSLIKLKEKLIPLLINGQIEIN